MHRATSAPGESLEEKGHGALGTPLPACLPVRVKHGIAFFICAGG